MTPTMSAPHPYRLPGFRGNIAFRAQEREALRNVHAVVLQKTKGLPETGIEVHSAREHHHPEAGIRA